MFVPTKLRVNWRTAVVFCGLVLGMGAGTALAPSAGGQSLKTVVAKPTARPKLVVMLVVDQMRADYVDKFQGQWTGGLKRLVEEGAWFREAAVRPFQRSGAAARPAGPPIRRFQSAAQSGPQRSAQRGRI